MTAYPATVAFSPGEEVFVDDRRCIIEEMVDLESVRVREYATGHNMVVSVSSVYAMPLDIGVPPALEGVSEKDMAVAMQRFEAIKPLIGKAGRTRSEVSNRASSLGIHTNTLYKWVRLYEDSQRLTSLVAQRRADKGSVRLSASVESIIMAVLESEYLTVQKKKPAQVIREVKRQCLEAGVNPPHSNTVRNRIKSLSAYKVTARRHGRRKADADFAPIQGQFPNADWPLAVVQIDHTQLDIILVDDLHRQPIGRPWITLATDVFSRMVFGFHVSFDPPGAASTGLCLAQAILPKETWLAEREVKGEWPCWGLPKTIHMDNAKEFRGIMLQRACQQYGIDIEWRPVARPQFGGHVERLLGTIGKEIHALPGTTFSNPRERGEYDSDKQAALAFSEFEVWLTTYIVQVYHQQMHSALNMSPLDRYKEGVMGTDERPGVGIPARISDEERLRLDFMPFVERTIQDYGVVIDSIQYWHDVLRPWIGFAAKDRSKAKRQFVFRRDPRDISTIWFYDPELQAYYPIPYRDNSRPPISVWELREAMRRAKEEGQSRIDEARIFEAYGRMRELEETSKADTKAAKRARQRRKMGVGASKATIKLKTPGPILVSFDEDLGEDLQPFDEMDELS